MSVSLIVLQVRWHLHVSCGMNGQAEWSGFTCKEDSMGEPVLNSGVWLVLAWQMGCVSVVTVYSMYHVYLGG